MPPGALVDSSSRPRPPANSTYGLIERYTRPAMGAVWSDERRFQRWLDVELAAMQAWVELGIVPAAALAAVRERAHVDAARIAEIEARTHHDVLAFTESIAEQVGEEARWFHYGLTSSDVVDTALALQLHDAGELLLDGLAALERVLLARAEEFRRTPTVGRTHGVHAEPTTFGLKLLSFALECERQLERVATAFAGVRVGKLSGAVGAYGSIDARVEEIALEQLGLEREDVATQVVPRDRHAALVGALAGAGASLERLALEVRHLQRTEVQEVREPFGPGQKGSSAMPHKQNPIVSERIAGLARVLRGHALVALENVALWHERDISHSSAERVTLPDSTIALDYMLDRARAVIEGLVVDAGRMRQNLELSRGLVFSGRVLLELVGAGLPREAAYEIVQRCALASTERATPLRTVLEADPQARAALSPEALERAFDLEAALAHVDEIFDRALLRLEVAHA
jgi:adenylosuccinate lyase